MYESPRPRSRSDAPRSANANDRIRLSIPKDHVSSTASSVGPSIYDFELAAPSPQRRVLPQLLVNNEIRSTSHINNAAFSENSSIIGNGLQFTSSEDMATSPPHMLYPTRTQPHSNVSSPESHVSSKSFGTQPDGQSASQTGISPNRMRAKLLAQAIRDGRAEEPSRNGHAQYNQQERQSSIPSTPHSGHMNTTSVTGAMNAEVVPAMIALDPLIQKWKCKGGPTLSEAFDNLPFTERCRTTGPVNWGVIKIMDVSSCSNSAFDPIALRY